MTVLTFRLNDDYALRYRNLTDEEKNAITNGCGAKGGFISVPNFIFRASCRHHDFNYWLGNTEDDRRKADRQFYEAMKRDAAMVRSFWKRLYYRAWAWIYYKAVTHFGVRYFNYADQQKTWEDLYEEMDEGYDEGDQYDGFPTPRI